MRSSLIIPALAGLTLAVPKPQLTNIDALDKLPDPVLVSAPLAVANDNPPDVDAPPIQPITAPPSTKKRDVSLSRRDGNCAPQPSGSGPVPSPDTVEAFKSSSQLQALATNAPQPDGYSTVFTNLDGSLSASNYMGLYTLTSFDTLACAQKCDAAPGCLAINLYIERDPTLDPNNDNCPNPPSTTNYKCTLWGAPVVAEEATNKGQWRDQFQVVITGSNAYSKNAPPPAVDGFDGPTGLGGAINAPSDDGKNTYLGYQFFPFNQGQGYDPQTCANACNIQTGYNKRHPNADGTYDSCVFFNAYVLSQNAIPQGLYCSLYSKTWGPSYATNTGQFRGNDRYTVSRSYSYSLH
ncbi:MAG: hypothetical protein LQ351_006250 [Letrouitia transgressa]|nr:MAG: hypothetical protein LQ351_006250 [Letrouitia transgressa]